MQSAQWFKSLNTPLLDPFQDRRTLRSSGNRRARQIILCSAFLLECLILAVIFWSGLSTRLLLLLTNLTNNQILLTALMFVSVALALEFLVCFPAAWIVSKVNKRMHQRTRSPHAWLAVHAKAMLLAGAALLVLVEFTYFFLRVSKEAWWFWSALTACALAAAAAWLTPVFVLPWFVRSKPVCDGPLAERLRTLAIRVIGRSIPVYRYHSDQLGNATNAALAGIGRTRRLLLSDSLLNAFSQSHIEAVAAHELGHLKLGHFMWLQSLHAVLLLVVFRMLGVLYPMLLSAANLHVPSCAAGLPLLLLLGMLCALPACPVLAGVSRKLEYAADSFAIRHLDRPEDLVTTLRMLLSHNPDENDAKGLYHWAFATHPSPSERMARAQQMVSGSPEVVSPRLG